MRFAGLRNPPQSPPARARHCALGRWVYEKGEARAARAAKAASNGAQGYYWLASTALAGMRGPPPRFVRVRCTFPSQAADGLPSSYIAAFAWCPTVCRGTDDCGEHHPSTAAALAHPPGGQRGIWEDSIQAQGNTPYAPRGGLCGCLAVRHTCSKPPGVPTGWVTPQG
ncbi:predicted protein [Chaetomium globosum CBS 148.51]|uniref:Uncharacterized protein n=1 Tax=Chaetomium globosum (strain ATCC 6205 / CBS 148.51 / DSM 1962 / NBRC 6347 / NRRL 1970) TaxID=306901 RepID=Q2GLX3_CHAGB|nr:uncharacterized protein CHGG_11099 [Chaetomium globosum CBS 148.51]EAQ82863.1 predicted protein [Chaetomium globosum CBS 148.51]